MISSSPKSANPHSFLFWLLVRTWEHILCCSFFPVLAISLILKTQIKLCNFLNRRNLVDSHWLQNNAWTTQHNTLYPLWSDPNFMLHISIPPVIMPKEVINSNPADLHIFINMNIFPLLYHLWKSYSFARLPSNTTSSLKPPFNH